MKITAITKYKHGGIYAALQPLGWSQSELSRRTGIDPCRIGKIINLNSRPTVEHANRIQNALGEAGEYLDILAEWPELFQGLAAGFKVEQTQDIPMERLIDHPEAMELPAPDSSNEDERNERLESVIGSLPERLQIVLRERFWNQRVLEDVAGDLGCTREMVRQYEAKALRKLRHPERIKAILGIEHKVMT